MRHGTSNRRNRNRNSGRRNNQQRTQVYDSNGPDVRIRGTAHQVAEKYLALAKDASSSGDRIMAENYYQHAEHYIRIINENNGNFDVEKVMGSKSSPQSKGNEGNQKNDSDVKSSNKSKTSKEDDLSLPDSILGPDIKASQDEEKEEPVD